MSIRAKAFLIIISIVGVITASVIAVSIFFTETQVFEIIEKDMLLAAALADEVVTTRTNLLIANASKIAESLSSVKDKDLLPVLKRQVDFFDDFIAMSVFDESGDVVSTTRAAPLPAVVSESSFVQRALAGEAVLTPTRYDVTGDLVMRVLVPMNNGSRVLSATIPGLLFSNILSKFTIWQSGSIYIVDSAGILVASKLTDRVLERRDVVKEGRENSGWESLSGFVAEVLKNRSEGNNAGVGRYSLNGKERISAYRPIASIGVDWYIFVSAPIAESPAAKIQSLLLLAAVMFFGLGLITAFFASGSIAAPFNKIQELSQIALNASDAKSQFLANMSHEMRTPLNAIIGLSELILGGELPQPVAENLEKVYNSGMTLLGIVNDLLDISKIESGKFELIPAEYDLPSLINDTINLNVIRIGSKPITFKLQIDETLPSRLCGDELRIKQIFNNLLSNAFKYTRKGSVLWRISCQEESGTMWLTTTIKDSGIGIRDEDRERLFSGYNRLDLWKNRKTEGTGLGLVLAKSMAELMDGTISLESEYGKGSMFTVRIKQKPVNAPPIGEKVAENLMSFHYSVQKRRRNAGLVRVRMPYARVLVVDDVPINLDVARGMLLPYAMQVDCALSGGEAVQLIRKEEPRYDAVFMDHMMPEMDGIEALKIIRQEIKSEYAQKIPIIVLTANAIAGNEEMFLENGFNDFLSKPIDIMRLDAVLHRWVRDKSKEQNIDSGEAAAAPEPAAPAGGKNAAAAAGSVQPDSAGGQSLGVTSWNIEGLDLRKALIRFGGIEEVFVGVLRSYTVHIYTLLDALRNVPAPGETEKLEKYTIAAHSAKGTHYGISADETGKMAADLEQAARRGDFDFIAANNGALIVSVEKLASAIKEKLADSSPKPVQHEPDAKLLSGLKEACLNYRIDDIDRIMHELEQFSYETQQELVSWLRERINAMDFQIIAERLS